MPALENVRHEAFCLHYAKTGNATEAYKKAGYESKTDRAVWSSSNRLLKNDKVKARLKELADEMAEEKIADIREVQEKLTAIVRGEIKEENIVVESIGDGMSHAIIMLTSPKPDTIIKAGVELAKMQGGYIPKKSDMDKEEQLAKIDKLKAETARIKGEDTEADKQDDGFIAALRGEVEDIWDEQ